MNRRLAAYVAGLVALSAIALGATSCLIPVDPRIGLRPSTGNPAADVLLGVVFWCTLTLLASALPVTMPRGSRVSTATAPILASMVLGGPTAAGWVGLIGTTERRELSGEVPWYGTLSNHAGIVGPAVLGGVAMRAVTSWAGSSDALVGLAATLVGAGVYLGLNTLSTATIISLRSGLSIRNVFQADLSGYGQHFAAFGPLGWLMAQIYLIGWWATLLFVLPIYIMRSALQRVVEMREMFTQTIGALAGAVDARDRFTANHSHRVKEIAVDIGRAMRLSDRELEALEWGGLLHDVGKIGVPDAVLLKQDRLTKEERALMNRHPVIGAQIVSKVERLAPELPIIRHHHEWYNGSGYPDRLVGEEIPKLARVLHVADAFEAMIAQRPYRMRPLTTRQAIDELRKFSGIQFDPVIVDAFVMTRWADGIGDLELDGETRPVPLIAQAAARMVPPVDHTPADPT